MKCVRFVLIFENSDSATFRYEKKPKWRGDVFRWHTWVPRSGGCQATPPGKVLRVGSPPPQDPTWHTGTPGEGIKTPTLSKVPIRTRKESLRTSACRRDCRLQKAVTKPPRSLAKASTNSKTKNRYLLRYMCLLRYFHRNPLMHTRASPPHAHWNEHTLSKNTILNWKLSDYDSVIMQWCPTGFAEK